jgi:hypothetical protein
MRSALGGRRSGLGRWFVSPISNANLQVLVMIGVARVDWMVRSEYKHAPSVVERRGSAAFQPPLATNVDV